MDRLREGETILQKKSRGCLIHVSDFITPETSQLVEHDTHGNIVQDARQIIYPGSNRNAWWDTDQLIAQVKRAIRIHKKVNPGKTALFIFDQLLAHASLLHDTLKAFEMNKSDGSKQRVQQDTVIPATNPCVEFRGQVQKMTLADGKPKGLQRVLQE